MRILVTNDDGIHAEGLAVLEQIARQLSDDVWVVAPETDQSGVAHSLSLSNPLRLRQIEEKRFAVQGTPTDCVIMAVRSVMAEMKPDLVLSGVNRGQNVAEDVTYSGTIAAAMEGTLLGIPSIAVSQAYMAGDRTKIIWDCALQHAPGIIRRLLEEGIPDGILFNLNFPNVAPSEVAGVAVTAQGRRDQELMRLEPRRDGRGNPYYWIAFQRSKHEPANGTDLRALAENKISVTPLELDLTHEPTMTRFAQLFRLKAAEMIEEGASSESERTVAFLLSLRARGVRDLALLRAMERVPREHFAPSRFADLARQDVSVPLPCGQTMTAPHTVAALVGALEMKPDCRVLEVGSGSGYVAALLAAMGGRIVSLERYRTLALAAHERLTGGGFAQLVELRHADGFQPDRTLGRFERILVNGVMQTVPEALLARLETGGRLVGALRVEGVGRLVVVTRSEDGFDHALGGVVRIPPLAPGLSQAL